MKFLQFTVYLFFLVFFSFFTAYSQSIDSIVDLQEVTVTGSRFKQFSTGHFYTTIDSITKASQASANLGDILTHSSLFQINNYGTGSVSVSARGMGEKRTPVVWNGFNIQSIISTGTDLSQLPCFFFDDMYAQMGGSSALFGSGTAGGVLFLNNKQRFNEGFNGLISSHTGSFGNYYGGARFSGSNSIYSVSIKGYYNTIKNNFPYHTNYYGKEIDTTQSNASSKQYGFMMNNSLRLSTNQLLNVNIWYSATNKDIAPTLYDVSSHAVFDGSQNDEFFAFFKIQDRKSVV